MKVDCFHPRARHQHGTQLAYKKDDCHRDYSVNVKAARSPQERPNDAV